MKNNNNKKLVVAVSFNWADKFKNNPQSALSKLKRDNWDLDKYRFLFINWAPTKDTYNISPDIEVIQLSPKIKLPNIFYELVSVVVIPYVIWRKKAKAHIYFVRYQPLILAGWYSKYVSGAKIVFRFGGFPDTMAKTKRFPSLHMLHQKLVELCTSWMVDRAVVVNKGLAEYAIKMGIHKDAIRELETNTILHEQKYIEEANPHQIIKQHDLHGKKVMLYVGRLEPEKNIESLIKHTKYLSKEYVLLVVGPGDDHVYRRQAQGLDINDRVIFAGSIGRSEIWNYYEASDFFVLLSHSEGVANVIKEAMYMKKPIIGSNTGGIPEHTGSDQTRGWLMKNSADSEEFKKIIEDIENNKKETEKKINKAYEYIERKLSKIVSMEELMS